MEGDYCVLFSCFSDLRLDSVIHNKGGTYSWEGDMLLRFQALLFWFGVGGRAQWWREEDKKMFP